MRYSGGARSLGRPPACHATPSMPHPGGAAPVPKSDAPAATASAAVLAEIAFPESLAAEQLAHTLGSELKILPAQVLRTLELLDAGNTVPFIARYRKELTGNLDEVQIQAVADRAEALRSLHARKHDVLRLIAEQDKLAADLARTIVAATTLQAVEDLYLPFRPKRKTRASVARERGLQPLADLILRQERLPGGEQAAEQ